MIGLGLIVYREALAYANLIASNFCRHDREHQSLTTQSSHIGRCWELRMLCNLVLNLATRFRLAYRFALVYRFYPETAVLNA